MFFAHKPHKKHKPKSTISGIVTPQNYTKIGGEISEYVNEKPLKDDLRLLEMLRIAKKKID
jgi:hypothetical protein